MNVDQKDLVEKQKQLIGLKDLTMIEKFEDVFKEEGDHNQDQQPLQCVL